MIFTIIPFTSHLLRIKIMPRKDIKGQKRKEMVHQKKEQMIVRLKGAENEIQTTNLKIGRTIIKAGILSPMLLM